ncbi:MAG: T9SS type A sorting domain-containing protein [Bacteroidia bacterium]
MHKIKYIFVFAVAVVGAFLLFQKKRAPVSDDIYGMDSQPPLREKWLMKMLADPATGLIPDGIRQKELAYSGTLPVADEKYKTNAVEDGFWSSRGPWNIGGRTRAIGIDRTAENIILAGAATGGIWRSTDNGGSWTLVTSTAICNITSLVQDPRAGKNNIWYASTGEYYGGYVPGANYLGNGLLKSTDNGITWTVLSSTSSGTPQTFDNNFDFIHRVAINKSIDTADVIYLAAYDGVYRSLNGGANWNKRRGGGGISSSVWTDVAVTPSGIVYATLSGGGGQAGIWRSSNNGVTWVNITPAGFVAGSSGRIVIGISPSDENQVFFLAHAYNFGKLTVDFQGREEWNALWKYTYLSGDGTGAGAIWSDRSANMPALGGDFGDFISQRGYCLDVQVHPKDTNVVFVGGTGLFRSADGFSTSTKTSWVGGYAVNTKRPDFQVYPNQHPDQHGVIFYPSSPNRMISVHDGGISRTENCLAQPLVWQSLNRGYLTTQFYSVAIDRQSTNDVIIGGLQDNGTLYSGVNNVLNNWELSLTYDGGYCFVGANAQEYYMAAQQGRVFRMKLDNTGKRIQSARLDPAGILRDDYEFINPYTPDANNWNILYHPTGRAVWRNSDVSAIPLSTALDTNRTLLNWQKLSNTQLADSTEAITAITSAKNSTGTLYYGTSKGQLFKINNAQSGDPVPSNINGSNFPGGYINCITVDPDNANKLYAVFTNYSVLSVFETTDGGATWVPVSGNLEQNANGTGNGPSCRWMTIARVNGQKLYFLGTSTGLYAADSVVGMNTTWIKQSPSLIGSNIVTMMDYRETDNRIAVATFGAGMFNARLNNKWNITSVKKTKELVTMQFYPNPCKDQLHIKHQMSGNNLRALIYDLNGRLLLQAPFESTSFDLPVKQLAKGNYVLILRSENASDSRIFNKE